ncbi:hypothetical protein K1X84_12230 [bacterium]|nr:hypothetical protein [bacterium]
MSGQYFQETTISFVLLAIILFYLVVLLVRKTQQGQNHKVTFVVIAAIMFWFILTSVLAASGFLMNFTSIPPRLITVLLPPLILMIVLSSSKKITLWLKQVPPQWLIYIQAFRIIIEMELWLLFLDNIIPVQMTFEGRNFDVLVGLTAPLVAYGYSKRKLTSKVVLAWNILGLLILANIVIIAIVSLPVPFRVFMNEPANTIVAYWPYVWLPGFFVPVAYTMHALSIKQMWDKIKTGGD